MSEPSESAAGQPSTDETSGGTTATAAVARARADLDRLAELDLAEHPDAYQRIHAELQDALAAIDDA
jgi:hypothetical protein